MQQIEHLDDAVGPQIEMLAHQLHDSLFRDLVGAEGGHRDRGRLGHPDGVADLQLALVGQPGGNDVLGHVAPGIGGRTIDLGRILAGKCAAAVARHSTVGIDDDLSTRQTGIADRTADDEFSGRVDVVTGAGMQPLGRQHRLDDVFAHAFTNLLELDAFVVLG